jgi:hypothetical protein
LTVEVSKWSLQSFVEITKNPSLSSYVKDVTVVGLVYDWADLYRRSSRPRTIPKLALGVGTIMHQIDQLECGMIGPEQAQSDITALRWANRNLENLHRKGRDVELMRAAFSNIAAVSPSGLQSLSLEVAVYHDNAGNTARAFERFKTPWELFFGAACRTFRLAMAALKGSSLKVKSLTIFNNIPSTLAYSLPCIELGKLDWNALVQSQTLRGLKKLSLSISDQIPRSTEEVDDSKIAELLSPANYSGLPRLLLACPEIEDLYVSIYRIPAITIGKESFDVYDSKKERRAKEAKAARDKRAYNGAQQAMWQRQTFQLMHFKLHCLRIVRFGGFTVTTADFALFLRNHKTTIQSLVLHHIRLKGDPLSMITRVIAGEMSALLEIRLQDITERYFSPPEDEDGYSEGEDGCWRHGLALFRVGDEVLHYTELSGVHNNRNIIRCWGSDVKKEIKYNHESGMRRNNRQFGRDRDPKFRDGECNKWDRLQFGARFEDIDE